jgi:hypothetical protein
MQDIEHSSPDLNLMVPATHIPGMVGIEIAPALAADHLTQDHLSIRHSHYQAAAGDIRRPIYHQDVSRMDAPPQAGFFLGPQKKGGGRVGLDQGVQTQTPAPKISAGSGESGGCRGKIATIHQSIPSSVVVSAGPAKLR